MPKRSLLRTIKDPFRDSADDPIEMEVLFQALSKIGSGEGLLPGAKAQGLGRIVGDGISLDDVNFPSGTVQQEWPLKSSSWQFKLLSTYRWPDLFVAWTLRLLVGERFRALFISSFNPTSSLDNIA